MNVDKLIKKYLKTSYEKSELIIKEKYDKINSYLLSKDITESRYIIVGFILTCIAADAFFSANEWELINKLLGKHSYSDGINGYISFVNEENRIKCKEIVDVLPKHIKEEFIELSIIVLCIDGRINECELTFLNKLLD